MVAMKITNGDSHDDEWWFQIMMVMINDYLDCSKNYVGHDDDRD